MFGSKIWVESTKFCWKKRRETAHSFRPVLVEMKIVRFERKIRPLVLKRQSSESVGRREFDRLSEVTNERRRQTVQRMRYVFGRRFHRKTGRFVQSLTIVFLGIAIRRSFVKPLFFGHRRQQKQSWRFWSNEKNSFSAFVLSSKLNFCSPWILTSFNSLLFELRVIRVSSSNVSSIVECSLAAVVESLFVSSNSERKCKVCFGRLDEPRRDELDFRFFRGPSTVILIARRKVICWAGQVSIRMFKLNFLPGNEETFRIYFDFPVARVKTNRDRWRSENEDRWKSPGCRETKWCCFSSRPTDCDRFRRAERREFSIWFRYLVSLERRTAKICSFANGWEKRRFFCCFDVLGKFRNVSPWQQRTLKERVQVDDRRVQSTEKIFRRTRKRVKFEEWRIRFHRNRRWRWETLIRRRFFTVGRRSARSFEVHRFQFWFHQQKFSFDKFDLKTKKERKSNSTFRRNVDLTKIRCFLDKKRVLIRKTISPREKEIQNGSLFWSMFAEKRRSFVPRNRTREKRICELVWLDLSVRSEFCPNDPVMFYTSK